MCDVCVCVLVNNLSDSPKGHEIRGKVYLLAKDQHGCRLLQVCVSHRCFQAKKHVDLLFIKCYFVIF